MGRTEGPNATPVDDETQGSSPRGSARFFVHGLGRRAVGEAGRSETSTAPPNASRRQERPCGAEPRRRRPSPRPTTPCSVEPVPRWWPLALLLCALTALTSSRQASASSDVRPENGVRGFDLVAPVLVGMHLPRTAEKHRGNSGAYDEIAPGYTLAAEGLEGEASAWDTSLPQTGKILNVGTDVTATQFQANLTSNGFEAVAEGVSTNGPFTVLSNGGRTYTIYTATSTGEASAQVFNSAGETVLKYRLGGP